MTPYIEADYSANYAVNLGNSKNASANFLEFMSQGLIVWSDSYAGKNEKMRFQNTKKELEFNQIQTTQITAKSALYKTVQTAEVLREWR